MKFDRRSLAGMGLFVLFAACLLFGIFYGGRVIHKFHLNPLIRPLPILMYHNVAPDGSECNDMTVTPSKLRTDFLYLLEQGYTPVLPRELLDPDSLPEKPVLISFDDGYASNYNLLFPLLKECGVKAVISPIVCTADYWAENFCNWYALREMAESGLVEIGSHSYNLHNPDNGSEFLPGGPNGVQRRRGESDDEFRARVLDDIQLSYDRITEEIGTPPTCFAYPFGEMEPDAEQLIDSLFPVSLITRWETADLHRGTRRLPRYTVIMEEVLSNLVP